MGQKLGAPQELETDDLDYEAPTERMPHVGARLELDAVLDTLGADEVRVLARIALRLRAGSFVCGTYACASTSGTSATKRPASAAMGRR
jgi:hypothetical protein